MATATSADIGIAADAPVINQQSDQQAEVRVSVHDRIVKSAEGGYALGEARDAAIGHVKNTCQDDRGSCPAKIPVGEQVRRQAVDGKSDEGEEIGVDAAGGKAADNRVQDVLKGVADFSRYHGRSLRSWREQAW